MRIDPDKEYEGREEHEPDDDDEWKAWRRTILDLISVMNGMKTVKRSHRVVTHMLLQKKCRTRAYPCVGALLSWLGWQRWKEVHPQVQRQGCAQEKTNDSLEKVNVEKCFIMVKELERKERLGVRRLGSQKNHGTQVTFSARVQNKIEVAK